MTSPAHHVGGAGRPRPARFPGSRAGQSGDGGFTLIEVLISVAVVGLVVGLVFQALVASQRVSQEVNSRWGMARTIQGLLNRVCDDIRRASAVDPGSTSTTLVLTTEAGEVTYEVDDGVLTRNGIPLPAEHTGVTSMELVYLGPGDPAPEASSPSEATAVSVGLVVESGGNSLDASSVARLRNVPRT